MRIVSVVLAALACSSSHAHAPVIFESDFNGADWLARFNSIVPAPWTEGLERTSLVVDQERNRTVLKVAYPAKSLGNDKTGAQWKTGLGERYDRLTVSYDVKFANDFDFVKGGKLPGLVGGHLAGHPDSTVTGGHKADGTNGWSARIMWRRDGAIVQYVYHMHQPSKWGEDFAWKIGDVAARFARGKWHRVKTEVTMNDVGKRNGRIRSWLDDVPALDAVDVEFRSVPTIGIDNLYFSTFFGGNDPSFNTSKDESVFFDHFVVEK